MNKANPLYEPVPFSVMMDGPTEIEWLVDAIMPRTTCGIVAGEPGIGKTWIVMDMVLALATGVPWVQTFETKKCKVLVVDEENAHVLVRRRFMTLMAQYQKYATLDDIHFLVGESIDITPLEHPRVGMQPSSDFTRLYNTIGEGNYDVVVLDSLTRVHHADENDSSRMSAVFSYVKRLMDDFGVSILFTHHFNKSKGHNNNRLRGSSDILAFPDYVLRVETDRSHNGLNDTGVAIEHGKSRWGENTGKFCVRLEEDETGNKFIKRVESENFESTLLAYLDVARSRKDIVMEMERKGLGDVAAVDRLLTLMVKQRKVYRPSTGIYQTTGASALDDLDDLM